jgi:hypothetical protein
MAADAPEAAKNLAHMTPEDAPVGVHFVDDDKAKFFPEGFPLAVERQECVMQHVGVREKNMGRCLAYLGSLVRRGVAIIDGRLERGLVRGWAGCLEKSLERLQLVPGECFYWK